MGKSRLVAEFVRSARAAGHLVAFGECPAFGANASYAVWREIWRTLARRRRGPAGRRAGRRARACGSRRVDPTLPARAPLLDLAARPPDPRHRAHHDARPQAAQGVARGPAGAVPAGSGGRRAARARAGGLPLDRVAVARPARGARPVPRARCRCCSCSTTGRAPSRVAGSASPAAAVRRDRADRPRAGRRRAADPRRSSSSCSGPDTDVPPALVELVTTRSRGNPFYLEELLNYVRGEGVDLRDEASLRALQAPGSLHSLILSRIDTLGESPRRTVKVASVVGPAFLAPTLRGVYPELGSLGRRARGSRHPARRRPRHARPGGRRGVQLQARRHPGGDLREPPVRDPGDAARARRRLHRADRSRRRSSISSTCWPTTTGTATTRRRSASSSCAPARPRRRGTPTQRRSTTSSVPPRSMPEPERIDVLLRLGKVLELTGDWSRGPEGGARGARARRAARRRRAPRAGARPHSPRRRAGRGATTRRRRCSRPPRTSSRRWPTTPASARSSTSPARWPPSRGTTTRRSARYEASLEIRDAPRRHSRASAACCRTSASSPSTAATTSGPRQYHEQALAIREELGDRWAIAVSLTNLGAIAVHQHDVRRKRAPGSRTPCGSTARSATRGWSPSRTTTSATPRAGSAITMRPDATTRPACGPTATTTTPGRWRSCWRTSASWRRMLAEPELALQLVGAADTLREEIGAPRAPALEQQLENELAQGAEVLGAEGRGGSPQPRPSARLRRCVRTGARVLRAAIDRRRRRQLPSAPSSKQPGGVACEGRVRWSTEVSVHDGGDRRVRARGDRPSVW